MCVKADVTHGFPISFVGTAVKLNCFSDPRFAALKQNYWSQYNECMDNKGFMNWIQNWYDIFRQVSDGPSLLLMDNCGDQKLTVTLDRVRIEFLPPRCTMKHQTSGFRFDCSSRDSLPIETA